MTPAPIPEELAKALEHARDESKPTLERMAAASAARDMLDGWLQQIAWTAREEGHSWAQVGSKLGTTKQAAQQRFKNPEVFAFELGEGDFDQIGRRMVKIKRVHKQRTEGEGHVPAEPEERRVLKVRLAAEDEVEIDEDDEPDDD